MRQHVRWSKGDPEVGSDCILPLANSSGDRCGRVVPRDVRRGLVVGRQTARRTALLAARSALAWPVVLGAGLGGASRREAMAITVTEGDVVGGAWFGDGRRIKRDNLLPRAGRTPLDALRLRLRLQSRTGGSIV